MTTLLIARHGNTFEAGTESYFVGQTIDLPLTQQGQAQARALGLYCSTLSTSLSKIYCGPLIRHQQTAQIIQHYIRCPLETMAALNELPLGSWEGLTEQQIKAQWPEQFQAWNEEGKWPEDCFAGTVTNHWTKLEQLLAHMTLHHRPEAHILWITSQGTIRLLLKFAHSLWEKLVRHKQLSSYKVRPGHMCQARLQDTMLKIQWWNKNPILFRKAQ